MAMFSRALDPRNTYDEEDRNSNAFRKLQVLVNKVLRFFTGMDQDTPTSVLATRTGQLSVHQRTAMFTLAAVHKTMLTSEPLYSFSTFRDNQPQPQAGRHQGNCARVEYIRLISRCALFYRGSRLYNQLPTSIASIMSQIQFKTAAKQWVRDMIPLQPP